jgi:hypothetical protein
VGFEKLKQTINFLIRIKFETVYIKNDVIKHSYAEMKVGTQRYIRVVHARMRTDTTSRPSPVCQSPLGENKISSRKRTKHFSKLNVLYNGLKRVRENYGIATVEQ